MNTPEIVDDVATDDYDKRKTTPTLLATSALGNVQ